MGAGPLQRISPLDQRPEIANSMSEIVYITELSAHRLLQTDFINRPIDPRPALKRAAVERYWLERMAAAEAEEQK
jgi:hypothetical protein